MSRVLAVVITSLSDLFCRPTYLLARLVENSQRHELVVFLRNNPQTSIIVHDRRNLAQRDRFGVDYVRTCFRRISSARDMGGQYDCQRKYGLFHHALCFGCRPCGALAHQIAFLNLRATPGNETDQCAGATETECAPKDQFAPCCCPESTRVLRLVYGHTRPCRRDDRPSAGHQPKRLFSAQGQGIRLPGFRSWNCSSSAAAMIRASSALRRTA